jgi:hypothetical protein
MAERSEGIVPVFVRGPELAPDPGLTLLATANLSRINCVSAPLALCRQPDIIPPAPLLAHTLGGAMSDFIRDENIQRYRKLIDIAEADPSRDEARYQVLLRLLADEVAKANEAKPR